MKIALIFSAKCSTYLPDEGFNIDGLYESRGLTGSESGIFNVAWGLSERGHEVHVFCRTREIRLRVPKLAGASVFPQDSIMALDYDAYIAWNDPDHLPAERTSGVKICSQQLNDFTISETVFDKRTDIYAFPSQVHADYVIKRCGLKTRKCVVVPNSTNIEFFYPNTERAYGSIAYTSSPDRGLHHLLKIFPLVRKKVPDASLEIYYRFWPWYQDAKENGDLIGQRARLIKEQLDHLGQDGENGVYLLGPVDNKTLGRRLSRTAVLAYPCAPVRFTEGFSIAVLDACAAGCMPIISGVDALPSIYQGAAEIIYGSPSERTQLWADRISHWLIYEEKRKQKAAEAAGFAKRFSRQAVSKMWEELILKGNAPL